MIYFTVYAVRWNEVETLLLVIYIIYTCLKTSFKVVCLCRLLNQQISSHFSNEYKTS